MQISQKQDAYTISKILPILLSRELSVELMESAVWLRAAVMLPIPSGAVSHHHAWRVTDPDPVANSGSQS